MSESSERHRAAASREAAVVLASITVSDSRTEETDVNGRYLRERIHAEGHVLAGHAVVRDDPAAVLAKLDEFAAPGRIILLNGGTGVSRRDNTFEALAGRLEKVLPGFGEIFRVLSFEEIGSAAILTRAVAGVYRDAAVFSMPGSPAAVRLAWERLIAPEVKHLAWELSR